MTKYVPRYVYFLRPVGMTTPIKIGITRIPPKRLMALSSWSPFDLEFIGMTPAGLAQESFIHRCFHDLHLRREWFRVTPLLLETINRILDGETIEEACAGIPIGPSIKKNAKGAVYKRFKKRGPNARFSPRDGALA